MSDSGQVVLRALCRAVLDRHEPDKWFENAERSVALALGFEGEFDRRELWARMAELRKSWEDEPVLPSAKAMNLRELKDLKESVR